MDDEINELSEDEVEVEEEDDTGIIGQTGEFLKAVPRGFASGFLSSAEGIAELADATTNFVGLENLIDSGEENELVRLAREGRKSLNESFLGVDEKYKDGSFYGQDMLLCAGY